MISVANEGERADEELIRHSRARDQRAVEALYRRHHDAGYRYARNLLGNAPDAEDVAHEAFTKVMAAIARGHGPDTAFRPYYLRAVRTAAADKWDQQAKESPVEEVEEIPAEDPRLAFPPDNSQTALTAFQALPRRWQTVLWHAEVEREPPRRIAPLLGIEPNAVSALLLRARKGLREAYLRAYAPTPASPDCCEIFPLLTATVLGTATAQDRRASREHARTCDHCARAMADLTDVRKTMRGMIAPLLLLPAGALTSVHPSAGTLPRPRFNLQGTAARGVLTATIAGAAIAAAAMSTTAPDTPQQDVALTHGVTSPAAPSAIAVAPPPPAPSPEEQDSQERQSNNEPPQQEFPAADHRLPSASPSSSPLRPCSWRDHAAPPLPPCPPRQRERRHPPAHGRSPLTQPHPPADQHRPWPPPPHRRPQPLRAHKRLQPLRRAHQHPRPPRLPDPRDGHMKSVSRSSFGARNKGIHEPRNQQGRRRTSRAANIGNSSAYIAIGVVVPKGETYVPGSSKCATTPCEPVGVTANADGTTILVWSLGSPLAGTAITPITYQANIGSLVADGTSLVNTAVISASNDGSPASYRTATATVSVVNSASFAVEKSLVNPLTEPNAQKVFNLKFQNLSNNTYAGTDFIDWLPFNGDQRTPASNFHGSLTLAGPAVDAAGAQTVTFRHEPVEHGHGRGPGEGEPRDRLVCPCRVRHFRLPCGLCRGDRDPDQRRTDYRAAVQHGPHHPERGR